MYFYKEYDTLLNIAKKNLFNITDKINLTESDFEDEKQYIAIEPNKNSNTNKKEENKTIIYNCEKLVESINFMEKINLEDEQSIDLMITHPNGLIILFFLLMQFIINIIKKTNLYYVRNLFHMAKKDL